MLTDKQHNRIIESYKQLINELKAANDTLHDSYKQAIAELRASHQQVIGEKNLEIGRLNSRIDMLLQPLTMAHAQEKAIKEDQKTEPFRVESASLGAKLIARDRAKVARQKKEQQELEDLMRLSDETEDTESQIKRRHRLEILAAGIKENLNDGQPE